MGPIRFTHRAMVVLILWAGDDVGDSRSVIDTINYSIFLRLDDSI